MQSEIITPSEVSLELLHKLLTDAYIDSEIDDDGELRITEGYTFWAAIVAEGKRVKLMAYFASDKTTSIDDRLAGVNKINDSLIMIRASISATEPDGFVFDYYIPVDGGTTRHNLVKTIKLFAELISAATDKIPHLLP